MRSKLKLGFRILGYILIIHVLVSFIMVQIMTSPMQIESGKTPDDYNLNYEDISFQAEDGVSLSGWYIKSFSDADETVILMHGYPAESGDMLQEAAFLAQDFNIFMFDFRGLGRSEGYTTLGAKEVRDVHGAIDYLKEEKGVSQVSLWGFSMGGATALRTTSERDEVVAVVSDSSYSSMERSLQDIFPGRILSKTFNPFVKFWARSIADIDINEVSPEKSAREIEVPVYLIHSIDDPVIPIEHGKRLKEVMKDNQNLEVDFRDSNYHGGLDESIRERLSDFLRVD